MDNRRYAIALLSLPLLLLSSCQSPEPEIIQSDYSYTIDGNKVAVDIPEAFEYKGGNVAIIKGGNPAIDFRIVVTPKGTEVEETEVELRLFAKSPMSEDVHFTFREDQEAMEAAKGDFPDYEPLPLSALELPEVVMPKGEREVAFRLALKEDLSFLNPESRTPGYYTTLHLVSENPDLVLPGQNGNLIVMSVSVDHSNIYPDEREQTDPMYQGVQAYSPQESDAFYQPVARLVDGRPENGIYAYDPERDVHLILDLGSPQPLSGFRIHATLFWGNLLFWRSGEVWTSNDGDHYTSQGSYELRRELSSEADDFASFLFVTPITARYVKFVCHGVGGYGEIQLFGAE